MFLLLDGLLTLLNQCVDVAPRRALSRRTGALFNLPDWQYIDEAGLKSKAKRGHSSHNSVAIRLRFVCLSNAGAATAAPSIAVINQSKALQPSSR